MMIEEKKELSKKDADFLQKMLILVNAPIHISIINAFTRDDFNLAMIWAISKNKDDWRRLHNQTPIHVPDQPAFIKNILAGGKYNK